MKNFFDTKGEKITDKAFSRVMISSILGIFVCIVCLCSTTWAWFTASLPSSNNEIKAASGCLLSIAVKDGDTIVQTIDVSAIEDVTLDASVVYTVTLSLPAGSASGYCVIKAGDTSYYSPAIEAHNNAGVDGELSFTLTVSEDTTVSFIARWGTHSKPCDVLAGGALNINVE